jgi:phosphopantetheine--protein transferase-like protein
MEDLKKIISVFIKKDPESISNDTLINNKAISGSILIHRMYAAINKAGYMVTNYSDIATYGELIYFINNKKVNDVDNINTEIASNANTNVIDDSTVIGVDIESIDNFPIATDFREHEFYLNNFSTEEISYCLLKINPYQSFAGLFCAKEALCKVNNSLRSVPFNKINIQYTLEGKPTFQNYAISISHTQNYSIAVALLHNRSTNNLTMKDDKAGNLTSSDAVVSGKRDAVINISLFMSFISVLATVILIYLYLTKP